MHNPSWACCSETLIGYNQSAAGSSSTQAQKIGVSDHLLLGSLPLSIFLWTWRLNVGTTAREDILPTRSVPMMLCQKLSTWQSSSFRHRKSWGITGTLILARSRVDVVMKQNRINLPLHYSRDGSIELHCRDHRRITSRCLPACLSARLWSQKISVLILITCNKYCCQCNVAGILDCWMAVVDLSEDMAIQVTVELLPPRHHLRQEF